MRRRKSEPPDEKSNGIVRGLGDGIQKGDVFRPERFDIVEETSQKKREEGEEKRKREKQECKNETHESEDHAIKNKWCFFDPAHH